MLTVNMYHVYKSLDPSLVKYNMVRYPEPIWKEIPTSFLSVSSVGNRYSNSSICHPRLKVKKTLWCFSPLAGGFGFFIETCRVYLHDKTTQTHLKYMGGSSASIIGGHGLNSLL